jgi:hypothetical protein
MEMPCSLVELEQLQAKQGSPDAAFKRTAGLIAALLPPDRAEAFAMLNYVRVQVTEWFDSPD